MAPLRHDFSPSSILGKFLGCGMDPLSGIHAAGNFPFYTGTQGAPGGAPQGLNAKSATPQLPSPPTTPPPRTNRPTSLAQWMPWPAAIHQWRPAPSLINAGAAEFFLKSPPRHFEKSSDRDLLQSLPIALSLSLSLIIKPLLRRTLMTYSTNSCAPAPPVHH